MIVSLVLILVGSLGAFGFHTSFGKVSVSEITFETGNNNGVMSGLLYMPKGCSSENPCPAIVLTHGYLNSKEMQDVPAIEMSKRGYVVLATDMYDHGDSTWDTTAEFNFFAQSQYDAVQYMYNQDYVLKAADGDGMIAVSGHSMGGFSSELAVALDEWDFVNKENGVTAKHLGITLDIKAIVMSLVVAILIVVALYAIVWIIDIIFKTDFRFWTFAFKTFGINSFMSSMKYLPWFLVFYAISGINVISSSRNVKGFKGDMIGMLVNSGSVLLLLVI